MTADGNGDRTGRPTRVLLVSPSPPATGGIATWTSILLREVSRRSDVLVRHADMAPDPQIQGGIGPVPRVVVRSVQSGRDLFNVARGLVSFRPHVLHVTTSGGLGAVRDIPMMSLARLSRAAGVLDFHVSRVGARQPNPPWRLRHERRAIALATGVRVLDRASYRQLQGTTGRTRLWQLPNMIDVDRVDKSVAVGPSPRPTGGNPGAIQVVFVGRVVRDKGVLELAEACGQIEGVTLEYVGPVTEEMARELDHIGRRCRAGRWLRVLGDVDHRSALLRIVSSNLLALPSRAEAFPYVVLEAMALSRPVVTTDAGAMPEMIDAAGADPCGLSVPTGDLRALRGAIAGLACDATRRQDLGAAGRRRVMQRYSAGTVVPLIAEMWQEVAASARRQRTPEIEGGGIR